MRIANSACTDKWQWGSYLRFGTPNVPIIKTPLIQLMPIVKLLLPDVDAQLRLEYAYDTVPDWVPLQSLVVLSEAVKNRHRLLNDMLLPEPEFL